MDGEILNDQYYNYMEKLAANKAKQWKYPSTDAALLEMLNDNTYNYRAMYNKYGNSDTKHEGHFSDEFKTAFHPTFSTDSIYSGKRSQFNPTGIKGGVWVKPYQDHRGNTQYEQYCIGDRMWTPGFSLDRTRNYLNNAEVNNVMMLPGYPKFNIGKPQTQVALQDNIRSYRPVIVKPVQYKLKPDEQLIKLPGRKPQVVRRRNETISADNRSTYQKQQMEKKAVQIKQKYEQQKNQQEAAKGMQAIIKLASPSTYVGAVARSLTGDGNFGDNLFSGKGFNNTTANIAFDLAFPFALKHGSEISGEFLQNQMPGLFDPYTTFRGSLGYYGNSLIDRVIGTYGRRFHLPVKKQNA